LENLRRGHENPEGDVVLYGPRGNGKTVLAEQWRREAIRAGVRAVDVAGGPESAVANLEALTEALRGMKGFSWWRKLRDLRVGLGVAHLGEVNLAARWAESKAGLLRLLREAVAPPGQAPQPLILFLDEAHRVHVDFLAEVFRCSQILAKQGLPLLWVYSGTPALPGHFQAADATFWDRCVPLPLGRLAPTEAVAALREPLCARGWDVESGECPARLEAAAVKHAQCYPYFVQLIGKALEHWEARGKVLTRQALGAAEREFASMRHWYYGKRAEELEALGLLNVAVCIGRDLDLQPAGSSLREPEVKALLETMLREPVEDSGVRGFRRRLQAGEEAGQVAYKVLRDVGFLWSPAFQAPVELGIPSLATCLEEVEAGPVKPAPGGRDDEASGGNTA